MSIKVKGRNKDGTFKKGHVHSLEIRKKLSDATKSNPTRYWLGKKRPDIAKLQIKRVVTEETRKKISVAKRANPSRYWLGKKRPDLAGPNYWNWRGGVTSINDQIRKSAEYKRWRKLVFERDDYTCVLCREKRGGDLEADHIKPFAFFPKLRFEISNGRTLCKECHRSTETYGHRTNMQHAY